MNDRATISTAELFAMFPNQEAARLYLEKRLWPNGVRCPICGLSERIGNHSPGLYRCNQCDEAFSVRTGTVMERSKIPLVKWLHAMYLLVTSRKGISSMQLSKELSIRQASAWFLLHRLRGAVGKAPLKTPPILDAVVDALLDAKPKPRTKQAKKRARRAKRIQRKSSG